jgi:hypothetical protein
MGQYTMDSAEYDAMKKVEALLEKAVADKEELHKEIQKLNAEKIEVLQSNAQNVTMTTIKRSNESVMCYYSKDQILERVRNYFERGQRGSAHIVVSPPM